MNVSCMNSNPAPVCVCAILLPLVHVSLSSLCACVSQPPIKGRPPLPIRDVHRDWQFERHDLRPQHQRIKLLRGQRLELR